MAVTEIHSERLPTSVFLKCSCCEKPAIHKICIEGMYLFATSCEGCHKKVFDQVVDAFMKVATIPTKHYSREEAEAFDPDKGGMA